MRALVNPGPAAILRQLALQTVMVALVGSAALAAAPQRGLTLEVPGDPLLPVPPAPPPPSRSAGFAPAPLPNRDVDAPQGPRASTDPSVGPGLFTRTDTYRGEGFSKGSSAQNEQDKRAKPGAGLNLRMPFAPN